MKASTKNPTEEAADEEHKQLASLRDLVLPLYISTTLLFIGTCMAPNPTIDVYDVAQPTD